MPRLSGLLALLAFTMFLPACRTTTPTDRAWVASAPRGDQPVALVVREVDGQRSATNEPNGIPEWASGVPLESNNGLIYGVGRGQTRREADDAAREEVAHNLRQKIEPGLRSIVRQVLSTTDIDDEAVSDEVLNGVSRFVAGRTNVVDHFRDRRAASPEVYAVYSLAVTRHGSDVLECLHVEVSKALEKVQCNAQFAFDDFDQAIGEPPGMATDADGGRFRSLDENDRVEAAARNRSTFALDVDTGSYTLMRESLLADTFPPAAAIRVEEIVNWFDYGYAAPTDPRVPISITAEAAPSPFRAGTTLLRVGLRGYRPLTRTPRNVVVLIDTSGSMEGADRLPLVKRMLREMLRRLDPRDRVAIVTYGNDVHEALSPRSADHADEIAEAIDRLHADGHTAGGPALLRACELATDMADYVRTGASARVVVCTDGDFNVGVRGEELLALVANRRRAGLSICVRGFGNGNLNDADLEQIADAGNGDYSIIRTEHDARHSGILLAVGGEIIAHDAKIQLEFNPDVVRNWRLVGYENRGLPDGTFRADGVDGGELPAGHCVTAWYELNLVDEPGAPALGVPLLPLVTIRLRARLPDEVAAREFEAVFTADQMFPTFEAANRSFAFGTAVMQFGQVLRRGQYGEPADLPTILGLLEAGPADPGFRQLVARAARISGARKLWE